ARQATRRPAGSSGVALAPWLARSRMRSLTRRAKAPRSGSASGCALLPLGLPHTVARRDRISLHSTASGRLPRARPTVARLRSRGPLPRPRSAVRPDARLPVEVLEHPLQEIVLGDSELRLELVLLVERAVGAPQQLAEGLEHPLPRARDRREGRDVAPRR